MGIPTWTVNPVKFIKKKIDSDSREKYEWVQDQEGCPHLEVLDATGPTSTAYLCVGQYGGIAWEVLGHVYWYWHPQADFKPLTCNSKALRRDAGTGKVKTVRRPIPGKNCELCLAKIKAR